MTPEITDVLTDIGEELNRNGFSVKGPPIAIVNGGGSLHFSTHDHNPAMGITLTLTHSLRVVQIENKWKLYIASGVCFEGDSIEELIQKARSGFEMIIGIARTLKKGSAKAAMQQ